MGCAEVVSCHTCAEIQAKAAAIGQAIRKNGKIALNHCVKRILAMARPASSNPFVGEMMFVRPLPN